MPSARSKKRANKQHKEKKESRSLRKWDDAFFVTIYDLVREGYTMARTAKALGVTLGTLKNWIKAKPAIKEIVNRARGISGDGQPRPETFGQYVFKRLPSHLQEVWNKLCEYETESSPLTRIEALLDQHGKKARQHLFIHALIESNFNTSEACRKVNITTTCFRHWCSEDPNFADMIDEILWHKKNFVEGSLMKLVAAGDSAAVIFASKTLNRDRGYDVKMQLDISGDLSHQVGLEQLDLPVEVMRQILAAMQKKMIEGTREGNTIQMLPEPAEPMGADDEVQ